MPKPTPMTEYCSNFFDIVLLKSGNALPIVKANTKPMASAMGDVTHSAIHAALPKSNPNTSTAKPKSRETPNTATIAI